MTFISANFAFQVLFTKSSTHEIIISDLDMKARTRVHFSVHYVLYFTIRDLTTHKIVARSQFKKTKRLAQYMVYSIAGTDLEFHGGEFVHDVTR